MVRTKAPLLSLGASGQVGGVLVASNWKGRNYSKKLTIPKNPNSGPQVGVRACMRHLTQHWSTLSNPNKATWAALAIAQSITSLDAYIQTNLLRWSTGAYPGETNPVTGGGGAAQQQSESVLAYGRGIQVSWQLGPFLPQAHAVIYRSLSTGFTPAYQNARRIYPCHGQGTYVWIDTPLNPATYYYRILTFTPTGKPSTLSPELDWTVT